MPKAAHIVSPLRALLEGDRTLLTFVCQGSGLGRRANCFWKKYYRSTWILGEAKGMSELLWEKSGETQCGQLIRLFTYLRGCCVEGLMRNHCLILAIITADSIPGQWGRCWWPEGGHKRWLWTGSSSRDSGAELRDNTGRRPRGRLLLPAVLHSGGDGR